jgi:hypothetical protein
MKYIIPLSLFESESPIKDGIDLLFEKSPGLAQIGTKEDYFEYLDHFFEKSRILYRGDFRGLSEFKYSESLYADNRGGKYKYGSGIYFDSNMEYSEFFAKEKKGEVYFVLVDFSNVIFFKSRVDFITKAGEFLGEEGAPTPEMIDIYTKAMQKGGMVLNIKKNQRESETVVGDQKKYRILGPEEDVENFKNWLSTK